MPEQDDSEGSNDNVGAGRCGVSENNGDVSNGNNGCGGDDVDESSLPMSQWCLRQSIRSNPNKQV